MSSVGPNKVICNDWLALLCFVSVFTLFYVSVEKTLLVEVSAQIVPLPPSSQQSIGQVATNNNYNNTGPNRVGSSPVIEFLTNSLKEGKDVVKVKITDRFPIRYVELRYVQNGQIITTGFVKDPNSVYKALIDVHPPSALIVVNAFDIYGNNASVVKNLDVHSLSDTIFNEISQFLYSTGKIIVSTFTTPKG
jgi:hypothetical protein